MGGQEEEQYPKGAAGTRWKKPNYPVDLIPEEIQTLAVAVAPKKQLFSPWGKGQEEKWIPQWELATCWSQPDSQGKTEMSAIDTRGVQSEKKEAKHIS